MFAIRASSYANLLARNLKISRENIYFLANEFMIIILYPIYKRISSNFIFIIQYGKFFWSIVYRNCMFLKYVILKLFKMS